nr:hypothetical protein NeseNPV-TR_ORF79 [Neodiprion sertifer nucleopolyhedrovirus]
MSNSPIEYDKIILLNRFNKNIQLQPYDWQVVTDGKKNFTISVLAKTVLKNDTEMPIYLKDVNKVKDSLTILI